MSKSKKSKKDKKALKASKSKKDVKVPEVVAKPFDKPKKVVQKSKRKIFLRWLVIACTMICLSVMAYKLGYYTELMETDTTKISFVLLTVLAYNTAKLGVAAHAADKYEDGTEEFTEKVETPVRFANFSAAAATGLGFIGTICGAIMLLTFFGTVDITNLVTVQNLITAIPMKMGVAFYTTLVGLLVALLIQIQCFNIEINFKNEKD